MVQKPKTWLSEITRDKSLKLFALAVSVVLFFVVSTQQTSLIELDYRVEYRTHQDLVITDVPPATLRVTMRNTTFSCKSWDEGHLAPVIIDLSGAGPGTLRRRVTEQEVVAPTGAEILSVWPAELEITLDRKVERSVPIQVDTVGNPAAGTSVFATRAEPSQVTIVGPRKAVRAIDYVYTQPLDITDQQTNLVTEVALRPPGPGMTLKKVEKVKVTVEIAEEFENETFKDLPVKARKAPTGTKISPERITLVVKGPRRLLDKISKDLIEVNVSLSPEADKGQKRFDKTVEVRLPEGLQLADVAPKVKITLPTTYKPHK